jgi:hypothetical protein
LRLRIPTDPSNYANLGRADLAGTPKRDGHRGSGSILPTGPMPTPGGTMCH